MKLLFAGIGESVKSYSQLLFNCTRNPNCQRRFFVPLKQWSDLMFFADLKDVGKPDFVTAEVLGLCQPGSSGEFNEDFGDDFNIGMALADPIPIVFGNYVIGQQPNGNWYGVFSGPVTTAAESGCFFLRVTFHVGETEYIFYSEEMCFADCDNLTYLRGCYPNEPVGAEAVDCNGVYYGFPTNEDYTGSNNLRYFHWAYIRDASVTETANKLSFAYFNSKKAYKNRFNRDRLLEFELVPTFYKDTIIGILNRGNIEVGGTGYRLSEEQTFNIIDTDSKLWKLDVGLAEECKQYFGCGVSDCALPVSPCDSNPSDVDIADGGSSWTFKILGQLAAGEEFHWEIKEKETNVVVATGIMTTGSIVDINGFPIAAVPVADGFDPAETCYIFTWRKLCANNVYSGYFQEQFGNCIEDPPPVIYYRYHAEVYDCLNCSEPASETIVKSTVPLILFKYYKSVLNPETQIYRPIYETIGVESDSVGPGPFNTCVICCSTVIEG